MNVLSFSRRFALAVGLAGALIETSPVAAVEAARTYDQVADWAQLPAGTKWQDMMAVDIDSKGDISVLQRTPFKVLTFSTKGKFLRSWGDGELPRVHGFRIDKQNNIWITDRKLHQVLKYTRDGKLLMALGTKGVAGDNSSTTALSGPADVAFGPSGEIFVADGESTNTRIVKFAKDGSFIKFWGTEGSEPGQLKIPHGIAIDAKGRLFVANRGNKRIEIFDQDGAVLGQITIPATPYGLFLDRKGILYVADGSKGSESLTVVDPRDSKVLAQVSGLNGSHMLTVDRKGAVYVAEVRGMALRKFVRK